MLRTAVARRTRWFRVARAVVFSVSVVSIVFALILPAIASYGDVWEKLRALSYAWIAALAVAAIVNIATFPLPWLVVIPGLTFLGALRVTQASTALISVVPGGAPVGMTVSFGMFRSQNISAQSAAVAVALTGLWNQVAIFLFPIVALAAVAADGRISRPLGWAAAAGALLALAVLVLIGVSLATPSRARMFGLGLSSVLSRARRLIRKGPVAWAGDDLVRLREDILELLKRRWFALTGMTLANQLTGYLMLELSLRAVGITFAQLSVAEAFAAWSIGRVLSSLPTTPGGIGVVELGLIGTLVSFGGPSTQVAAGVLLYRFLSVVPTLVLGALAGLTWQLQR
jgi:putative heme transporter